MIPKVPFYLDAVDPGLTTGLVTLHVTPDTYTVDHQDSVRLGSQHTGPTTTQVLRERVHRNPEVPRILVCESFGARRGQKSLNVSAVAVIADLRQWIITDKQTPYQHLAFQPPGAAKGLATDMVLRRLDLYAYGPDLRNVNDAFRHAVTWLARAAYRPLCEKAWPPAQRRH